MVRIQVYNSQKDLPLSSASVKQLVRQFLFFQRISTNEISIHFVSSRRMCQLHEEFFQDPSPTDCISFPIDSPALQTEEHVLGEIFVCPQTAIDYLSKKRNATLESIYHEVSLYVVHGLLHLIGYDDIQPQERKKMRQAEKKTMEYLKNQSALICSLDSFQKSLCSEK